MGTLTEKQKYALEHVPSEISNISFILPDYKEKNGTKIVLFSDTKEDLLDDKTLAPFRYLDEKFLFSRPYNIRKNIAEQKYYVTFSHAEITKKLLKKIYTNLKDKSEFFEAYSNAYAAAYKGYYFTWKINFLKYILVNSPLELKLMLTLAIM